MSRSAGPVTHAFATMAANPITRLPRSLNYDTPPGLEVAAAGSQGKIVQLSG
ncbi:MAG: ABC-type transport system involved in resistance to organic solvents, permease component [uncultured Paraburkholderia sp.]|nr:MAG: ABC-type transport system involved in resistance to organic solvents, permease component [uncultured Paraburkholderia sp.]CAH2918423.1 MAG: ABC-type transport system involved in resistance to organic solvents, permease component [uncultured Paraburkholderia sp.]